MKDIKKDRRKDTLFFDPGFQGSDAGLKHWVVEGRGNVKSSKGLGKLDTEKLFMLFLMWNWGRL